MWQSLHQTITHTHTHAGTYTHTKPTHRKLDVDLYKRQVKSWLVMLSQGLPSTSGFLMGFMLGLRLF